MVQAYFDYQTTTPLLPEAWQAMQPYFLEVYGSAGSFHEQGLRARDALQAAREAFVRLLHAESPDDILFTSSGTEAINLGLKGIAWNRGRPGHLICSQIEHPAILNSVAFLEQHGFTSTQVKVDAQGFIDPAEIARALTKETVLVAVHLANHDIATLQPVAEIARAAQQQRVPLFVDATSAGGWHPIDVQALGASLLAVAPHRFYGPKGVGVLYRHRRARLQSLVHGGSQEHGLRAGTENVPAIVGAGVAADHAHTDHGDRIDRTRQWQTKLFAGLTQRIPWIQLNGPPVGEHRLPTALNLSIEFVEGEGVMLMADTQGVAIASGTSCVSKALTPSHVLTALGLDPALARASVLLSVADRTTQSEIDHALDILPKLVQRLREMSPTWDEFQQGSVSPLTARHPHAHSAP